MTNLIMTLIPAWLLFFLALLATIHRWYISIRWGIFIESRWENILYAISLTNISVFYAGRWLLWWDLETSIAISRLVWAWLLIISLYISHRMAKRHRNNGSW